MSFLALYKADWKMTRRDPIMVYAIVMTIVLLGLIRFLKMRVSPELYIPLAMFGLLLAPMVFGMVPAFIMLDEKEEKVIQALQVVPVSTAKFLTYRLLNGVFFTVIFVALAPKILGFELSSKVLAMSVVLLSLEVPLLALFVIDFAETRMQGMTMMKIVGWILFAPIVIKFIVVVRNLSTDWSKFTAFLPTYWIYKFYEALMAGDYTHYFQMGVAVHLVWLAVLGVIFKKKIL